MKMELEERRSFLKKSALGIAGATMLPSFYTGAFAANGATRKYSLCLDTGSVGVSGSMEEILDYAIKYGFESIGASAQQLAEMSEKQLKALLKKMKKNNISWGTSGLTFNFRNDLEAHKAGMKDFTKYTAALEKAGVTRMSTWILPAHDSLTYTQNLKLHADRVREIATVLGDHGIRFGLEYVGPKTFWTSKRYPFVHSMAETGDLIAAIGKDNVGYVLDSYHWFCAEESVEDILKLSNKDVVSCDLNDAPDVPLYEQKDLVRALPMSTGKIDVKAYLDALIKIGFDGPVRCEPFDKKLNAMENEPALETTFKSMKKAFDLVDK
ncbi:sugar phosphate isomerase/epimerase [Flammeovirgaceae bacterium SG7u.111]|nr:sugar phosphate isomerase/epimerase [Flammeovirgaceae bacterium SG7u.132]WPO38137.1 sugar phosphate isomerase/epimerase [Flammeovirgaceae bacterium SG7u.111]